MALTSVAVDVAAPSARPFKMADGNGLYLAVASSGTKTWRLKYRHGGKESTVTIGEWPQVSLTEARRAADAARRELREGHDPGASARHAKKEKKATFELVAREWFSAHVSTWATTHSVKIIERLQRDVFPAIGDRHVSTLTPPDVLKILRRVEKRGARDTALRVKQNIGQVMRYAVATGRAQRDVTFDLKGALAPVQHTPYAALTDPKRVGKLIVAISQYDGSIVVRTALELLGYLFVRPGELRHAEWVEFDLDAALWTIPAARMKGRRDHLVPLPTQAVKLLKKLRKTATGRLLFPGRTSERSMSENTTNAALRALGYHKDIHVSHGFRSTASTLLNERLRFDPDVIEAQLAHTQPGVRGIYNRSRYIEERAKMMQAYADYLDALAVEIVMA